MLCSLLKQRLVKKSLSSLRLFSSGIREPQPYIPSEGSASDLDAEDVLRARIDPMRAQVYDFLRNVSVYEEQNLDVEKPYFMDPKPLRGFATEEGTDKFYRRSQNENGVDALEVHHQNFRSPFNSMVKVSTVGIGSYVGDPDDFTDFDLYDAIKQSAVVSTTSTRHRTTAT